MTPFARFRIAFLFVFTFCLSHLAELQELLAAQSSRPNFLIVLCDDLGYGDLGCFGNKTVQSPNIDRFAEQGLKLTHCYSAAPNCSPARTGLMTGRTPYRIGIHNWIPFDSPMHVGKKEIMIAKLLRDDGYATCHVGKWHMNGNLTDKKYPQPSDHGFDWSFGTQNNAIPTHRNPENFVRNGKWVGKLEGYASHLVTDEAIHWFKHEYDHSKPFFMYVAYHEPHEPIASDHKYAKQYDAIGKPSRYDPEVTSFQAHHGNITQMDAAFGRLMSFLRKQNLDENTVILFTSDNGPAITGTHPHGSTGGLRDKKGSVYEGGIRVPGIVQWKGVIKPGRISEVPVCGLDVLPTFCDIAGVRYSSNLFLDGEIITGVLKGTSNERHRPLYWHFHATRGEHQVALRYGQWKLLGKIAGGNLKPFGDIRADDQTRIKNAKLEAFDLFHISDENSPVTNNAEKSAELQILMHRKFKSVLAESPTWPPWEWPRWEGKRIQAYVESLKQTK